MLKTSSKNTFPSSGVHKVGPYLSLGGNLSGLTEFSGNAGAHAIYLGGYYEPDKALDMFTAFSENGNVLNVDDGVDNNTIEMYADGNYNYWTKGQFQAELNLAMNSGQPEFQVKTRNNGTSAQSRVFSNSYQTFLSSEQNLSGTTYSARIGSSSFNGRPSVGMNLERFGSVTRNAAMGLSSNDVLAPELALDNYTPYVSHDDATASGLTEIRTTLRMKRNPGSTVVSSGGGARMDVMTFVNQSAPVPVIMSAIDTVFDNTASGTTYESHFDVYVAESGGLSKIVDITKNGLHYDADYSANYTARSLVDKGYVDSVAGGGGSVTANNGLTKIGDNVRLGGTLTGDTEILGNAGTRGMYFDQLSEFYTSSSDNTGNQTEIRSLIGYGELFSQAVSADTTGRLKVSPTGITIAIENDDPQLLSYLLIESGLTRISRFNSSGTTGGLIEIDGDHTDIQSTGDENRELNVDLYSNIGAIQYQSAIHFYNTGGTTNVINMFAGSSESGNRSVHLFMNKHKMIVESQYSGFTGVEYAGNYSANFGSRSLVDKGYVDSVIGGSNLTNKFWKTSGTTVLTNTPTIIVSAYTPTFSGNANNGIRIQSTTDNPTLFFNSANSGNNRNWKIAGDSDETYRGLTIYRSSGAGLSATTATAKFTDNGSFVVGTDFSASHLIYWQPKNALRVGQGGGGDYAIQNYDFIQGNNIQNQSTGTDNLLKGQAYSLAGASKGNIVSGEAYAQLSGVSYNLLLEGGASNDFRRIAGSILIGANNQFNNAGISDFGQSSLYNLQVGNHNSASKTHHLFQWGTGLRNHYGLTAWSNWTYQPKFIFGTANVQLTGATSRASFVIANGLLNNGSHSDPSTYHSHSFTHLNNGWTQINTRNNGFLAGGTELTESDVIPKAALDVVSINSGILVPRLTNSQFTGMTSGNKVNGLILYESTNNKFKFYQNSSFVEIPRTLTLQTIALTGGTYVVDLSQADVFIFNMSGSTTLNHTGGTEGKTYIFRFIQDTTAKTLTWNAGRYRFSFGNAPLLTNPAANTPAHAEDIVTAIYRSSRLDVVITNNLQNN